MRSCDVLRSAQFQRLRPTLALPLFLALEVAGAGIARAQTPEQRGGRPQAADTNTQGPVNTLRRRIDPRAQTDPFTGDRDAEDDRDNRRRSRRGRALEGSGDIEIDPAEENSAQGIIARDESDEDAGRTRRLPDESEDQRDDRARELVRESAFRDPSTVTTDADTTDVDDVGAPATAQPGPYDALGVRVGSFLLFPEISVGTLFSDNPRQSTINARGDHAYVLSPSLNIRSDWSRHSLEGSVTATRSYFDDFTEQDDETYLLTLRGRLDVTRRTAALLDTSYLSDKEEASSNDTPAGAAERTPFTVQGVSGEVRHRFNRLTASLRGRLSEEDYEDVALIGGGIANNDDRDLTERELTGRLSYELRPGVAAFVEAAGNEREFDQRIDDNGILSGSDGYQVLSGITLEWSGKLSGEIALGFARQTPDDTRLEDISGLIINAGLLWRATPLTTFRFNASSEVDESTQTNTAGALMRRAEVSAEHRFRENIIAGVLFGYEVEDFSGSGQKDEDYTIGVTGEYLLTRTAALTSSYEFTKSTSNAPGNDFVENQILLGFRLRR